MIAIWLLGFGICWDNAHMTRRSLVSMLPLMLLTAARGSAQRTATVYKDPNCGCCTKWVDLLRTSGFAVTIRNVAELDRLRYPVPPALRSCHTAIIDGHIIEGHVPIADIERMLKQGSAVTGVAVPGMPIGSPGMEVPGTAPQPFNVLAFDKSGSSRIFATYGRG
jgi:hypothetical protein